MRKIMCIILSYSLIACGAQKTSAKNLTGKWKPVHFHSNHATEKDVRDIIENASVEFSADLRFRSYIGNKLQDEGSYSIDKKTQNLIVNNGSEQQVYTVKWAGDTLILNNPQDESMRLVRHTQ